MTFTDMANLPPSVPGENPLAQAEWLRLRIADGIDYVSAKRTTFRDRASRIRLVVLLLSSLITVALGIRLKGWEDILRNVAFVLGAYPPRLPLLTFCLTTEPCGSSMTDRKKFLPILPNPLIATVIIRTPYLVKNAIV